MFTVAKDLGNFGWIVIQVRKKILVKRYYEFNREERFYCSLLQHVLLISAVFRRALLNRLDPSHQFSRENEIYTEVSILRDYWHDLGQYKTNGSNLATINQKREIFLNQVSAILGTKKPSSGWPRTSKGKYIYPGRWSGAEKKVKLVFNAKPDMYIINGNCVFVIEAKLESPEGSYYTKAEAIQDGYDAQDDRKQMSVQKQQSVLIKKAIPGYENMEFRHFMLTLRNPNNSADVITWHEIVNLINRADGPKVWKDRFTRKSFETLKGRYSG